MTVGEALAHAATRLASAGVPEPDLDAERLLRHVLGWDRARLLVESGTSVPAALVSGFDSLVAERAARRPLQHLLGTQAFWRHEFLVTPDVLIPRPETELVVERALALLAGRDRPRLADVGTGSGCIALSLAAEREDAEVHAVDLSPAALVVARANAVRLGLQARVEFHEGDLLQPLAHLGPVFDLVASNPPYVAPEDLPKLQPEVRDHEPRLALHAAEGRLSLYRRLCRQARAVLRPDGHLVVEMGHGMEDEVRAACADAGLTVREVVPDLQGIARTVVASPVARS